MRGTGLPPAVTYLTVHDDALTLGFVVVLAGQVVVVVLTRAVGVAEQDPVDGGGVQVGCALDQGTDHVGGQVVGAGPERAPPYRPKGVRTASGTWTSVTGVS